MVLRSWMFLPLLFTLPAPAFLLGLSLSAISSERPSWNAFIWRRLSLLILSAPSLFLSQELAIWNHLIHSVCPFSYTLTAMNLDPYLPWFPLSPKRLAWCQAQHRGSIQICWVHIWILRNRQPSGLSSGLKRPLVTSGTESLSTLPVFPFSVSSAVMAERMHQEESVCIAVRYVWLFLYTLKNCALSGYGGILVIAGLQNGERKLLKLSVEVHPEAQFSFFCYVQIVPSHLTSNLRL